MGTLSNTWCFDLFCMFTDGEVRMWRLLSWHGLNEIPTTKSQAQFQTYPLQTYMCFSPLTSGLTEFGHICTPSHRPWTEAYYSKIFS